MLIKELPFGYVIDISLIILKYGHGTTTRADQTHDRHF